ncbi:hypothetical protein HKD37_18G050240 [Glycine soja]
MAKVRGFPLLGVFRLWISSLESYETRCVFPFLLPTPFICLRQLTFHAKLALSMGFRTKRVFGLRCRLSTR